MKLRLSVGFGFPTLILFGSTLAHLYLAPRILNGYPAGGIVGGHTAEILQAFLGVWGSLILLYSLLITTFVATTKLSVRALLSDYAAPLLRKWAESISTVTERMTRSVPALAHSSGSLLMRGATAFKPSPSAAASKDRTNETEDAAVKNKLDPLPPEPLIRTSSRQVAVSDSQIVETVAVVENEDVPMMTTSKNPVVDEVIEADSLEAGGVPAGHVALEKPIVNRRKAQSQPAEQIEIPLQAAGGFEEYRLPPLHFLDYDDSNQVEPDPEFLQNQAVRLVEALKTCLLYTSPSPRD